MARKKRGKKASKASQGKARVSKVARRSMKAKPKRGRTRGKKSYK